jgi:hypothetical protein
MTPPVADPSNRARKNLSSNPSPHKPFSMRAAFTGAVVGMVLVALVAAGLWNSRVIPRVHPRPVTLSMQSLPEKVLGYERPDIEWRHAQSPPDKVAAQLKWLADYDAAQEASFRATYGGDGVDVSYGLFEQVGLSVTAVNGDLNLPVAATAAWIQYLTAVTRFEPLAVTGTTTSQCVYRVSETADLADQTADQLMSDLVSKRPANGRIVCVRRSPDRNLSVQIQFDQSGESGATAAQVAAEVAAETDRVWQSLD